MVIKITQTIRLEQLSNIELAACGVAERLRSFSWTVTRGNSTEPRQQKRTKLSTSGNEVVTKTKVKNLPSTLKPCKRGR